MLRIAALNESSSSESENETLSTPRLKTTKEAQESQALVLYNQALSLHRHGDHKQAEDVFHQILHLPWLQEVPNPEEGEDLVHPALILKYSIYKNLASMASQRQDYQAAMESYLQAVAVDSRDVMVWFKMGLTALKLENLKLASFAFEQGLESNPNHWPCLDNLCTVLYAINNYENCLYYISKALERDSGYVKGLALRKAMLTEQPSLEEYSKEYFQFCDGEIYTAELTDQEYKEVLDRAIELRQRHQELRRPAPLPVLPFRAPLDSYCWKSFGEKLVELYDYILTQESPVTLSCRVDMDTLTCVPPVTSQMEDQAMPEVVDIDKMQSDSRSNSNLPAYSQSEESCDIALLLTPSVATEESSDVRSLLKASVPAEHKDIATLLKTSVPIKESSDAIAPLLKASVPNEDIGDVTLLLKTAASSEVNVCSVDPAKEVVSMTTAATTESQDPKELLSLKKGQKRKRNQPIDDPAGKRRSARVRNTRKREEEEIVNYHEVLVKFLPSTLLTVSAAEETLADVDMETVEFSKPEEGVTDMMTPDVNCLANEEEAVKDLIRKRHVNSGVLQLMRDLCDILSSQEYLKWPDGLCYVYVEVYNRLRRHIQHPDYYCRDRSDEYITKAAKMCLVWAELKMDNWLSSKPKSIGPSPLKSPERAVTLFGADFPGKYFESDVFYMVGLTGRQDIMSEFSSEYTVRVCWLRARFLMLQGKIEEAVIVYEYLKKLISEDNQPVVQLVNCTLDSFISKDSISGQLDSLQRCQNLEEVQKLHQRAEYSGVIKLLLHTLSEPPAKTKSLDGSSSLPERNTQLLLLLDALHNVGDYKQVVVWGEVALHEMVVTYFSDHTKAVEREEMAGSVTQVLTELDRSVSHDRSIIKALPSTRLVRLVSNLLKLIESVLEAHELVTDMPLGTMLPWILLCKLIENEELKMKSILSSTEEFDSCLPSSIMLLKVAHDFLARRSWCTSSDGALLIFMVDVIMKELNNGEHSSDFRKELETTVEQCFYCLYGHPNRKTKAKHLEDHGASTISLNWDRSVAVFEYFKPKAIPEYDSYKSNTVSSELENLLQRITKVIPSCDQPANTPESLSAYIDGDSHTPPTVSNQKGLPVVREIYYLLADYYFKNKETKKAIEFYVQDLCCNPDRFDSWAGLALARSSKVEARLSSCEMQREGPSFKQTVVSALRCFKRALEIDDTSGKLWLEYGGLAYRLHSHASRQLKQSCVGEDDVEGKKLKCHCQEMLKLASDCYNKASQCEDEDYGEEWLQHYMLGKVAEKMGRPPSVYLEHYAKASRCLHEEGAKYPKKINYIVQPPHLAIEALEMHYRLHVSALKYVLRSKENMEYDLIKKFLLDSADSPYSKSYEKKKERRYSTTGDGGKLDSSNDVPMKSEKTSSRSGVKPTVHATPQDHDYLRHKSPARSSGDSTPDIRQVTVSDLVNHVLNTALGTVSDDTAGEQLSTEVTADLCSLVSGSAVMSTLPSTGVDSHMEREPTPPCVDDASHKYDERALLPSVVSSHKAIEYAMPYISELSHRTGEPTSPSISKLSYKAIEPTALSMRESSHTVTVSDETDLINSPVISNNVSDGRKKVTAERSVEQPLEHGDPVGGRLLSDWEVVDMTNQSVDSAVDVDDSLTEHVQPTSVATVMTDGSKVSESGHAGETQLATAERCDVKDSLQVSTHNHSAPVGPAEKFVAKTDVESGVGTSSGTTSESMSAEHVIVEKSSTKCESMDTTEGATGHIRTSSTLNVLISDKPVFGIATCLSAQDLQEMRFRELVELCLKGLHLTLTRYPHHYKALYRLAHLYATAPDYKDMEKAKNLLLGPAEGSWIKFSDYMPCPPLFSERKTHNFFNGVWKIPVEDVDRSGSFAAHLCRTLLLLMNVLTDLKEAPQLQYLHTFLNKKPDAGRKFLRDADRIFLSKKALECCLDAYLGCVPQMFDSITEEDVRTRKLLDIYRLWQQGTKDGVNSAIANRLLELSYRACCKDQVEDEPSVVEQARRYCQQHLAKRNPTTPSQSENMRSNPNTPSSVISPVHPQLTSSGKMEASPLTLSPQGGIRSTKIASGNIPLKICSVKLKPIETIRSQCTDRLVETSTGGNVTSNAGECLQPVSSSFTVSSLVSKVTSSSSSNVTMLTASHRSSPGVSQVTAQHASLPAHLSEGRAQVKELIPLSTIATKCLIRSTPESVGQLEASSGKVSSAQKSLLFTHAEKSQSGGVVEKRMLSTHGTQESVPSVSFKPIALSSIQQFKTNSVVHKPDVTSVQTGAQDPQHKASESSGVVRTLVPQLDTLLVSSSGGNKGTSERTVPSDVSVETESVSEKGNIDVVILSDDD